MLMRFGYPPCQVDTQRTGAATGRAASFRNLVLHAYADLDLLRVHTAATSGPADLRPFLAALRDHAD